MFRPDGMRENPFTVEKGNLSPDAETEANIWEAGADAMLEALWKMAKESPTGTFTFDANEINVFSAGERNAI